MPSLIAASTTYRMIENERLLDEMKRNVRTRDYRLMSKQSIDLFHILHQYQGRILLPTSGLQHLLHHQYTLRMMHYPNTYCHHRLLKCPRQRALPLSFLSFFAFWPSLRRL